MINDSRPNFQEDSEKVMITQQLLNILDVKFKVASIRTLAHRTTARCWEKLDLGISLPSTALAAISGASALSSATGNNQILTGILGLIVALLTSINTFLTPNKRSNDHIQFSARYAALRDRIDWFRSLKCIEEQQEGKDDEKKYRPIHEQGKDLTQEIQNLFKELMTEFNELEAKAPMPFQRATNQAKWKILGPITTK